MLAEHIEKFFSIQHNEPTAFNKIQLEFIAIGAYLSSIDEQTAEWWKNQTRGLLLKYAEFNPVTRGSNPIQKEANRRQDELDAIQVMLLNGNLWIEEILSRGVLV